MLTNSFEVSNIPSVSVLWKVLINIVEKKFSAYHWWLQKWPTCLRRLCVICVIPQKKRSEGRISWIFCQSLDVMNSLFFKLGKTVNWKKNTQRQRKNLVLIKPLYIETHDSWCKMETRNKAWDSFSSNLEFCRCFNCNIIGRYLRFLSNPQNT